MEPEVEPEAHRPCKLHCALPVESVADHVLGTMETFSSQLIDVIHPSVRRGRRPSGQAAVGAVGSRGRRSGGAGVQACIHGAVRPCMHANVLFNCHLLGKIIRLNYSLLFNRLILAYALSVSASPSFSPSFMPGFL